MFNNLANEQFLMSRGNSHMFPVGFDENAEDPNKFQSFFMKSGNMGLKNNFSLQSVGPG